MRVEIEALSSADALSLALQTFGISDSDARSIAVDVFTDKNERYWYHFPGERRFRNEKDKIAALQAAATRANAEVERAECGVLHAKRVAIALDSFLVEAVASIPTESEEK